MCVCVCVCVYTHKYIFKGTHKYIYLRANTFSIIFQKLKLFVVNQIFIYRETFQWLITLSLPHLCKISQVCVFMTQTWREVLKLQYTLSLWMANYLITECVSSETDKSISLIDYIKGDLIDN